MKRISAKEVQDLLFNSMNIKARRENKRVSFEPEYSCKYCQDLSFIPIPVQWFSNRQIPSDAKPIFRIWESSSTIMLTCDCHPDNVSQKLKQQESFADVFLESIKKHPYGQKLLRLHKEEYESMTVGPKQIKIEVEDVEWEEI